MGHVEKRPADEVALRPRKFQRNHLQRVVCCGSVCRAAEELLSAESVATWVKRPLPARVADAFRRYVAAQPRWPDAHELHPLEASDTRAAFTCPPSGMCGGGSVT